MKRITQTGTKGLLVYLRQNFPAVYQQFSREISDAGTLQGFGAIDPVAAASSAPPSNSLADTISQIANTVAQGYLTVQQQKAQSKILDAQLEQAKKGLAPLNIDPTQYGLPAPASPSFSIATLPWGKIGLGFAALLGFALLLKGRRRRAS